MFQVLVIEVFKKR